MATSASFVWVVPPRGIIDNIKKMRRATVRNCRKQLDDFAEETEQFMKDNHGWNNDTGTAEDSLTAKTSGSGEEMNMEIGYDLGILTGHPDGRKRDYSVHLEANPHHTRGYIGIIEPTKQVMFPRFMPKLSSKLTL